MLAAVGTGQKSSAEAFCGRAEYILNWGKLDRGTPAVCEKVDTVQARPL